MTDGSGCSINRGGKFILSRIEDQSAETVDPIRWTASGSPDHRLGAFVRWAQRQMAGESACSHGQPPEKERRK